MTSFKYKYKKLAKPKLIHVRIENSWYGSSLIWTSTGTDGSQNYLEHCRRCEELTWFYQLSVPAVLDNSRGLGVPWLQMTSVCLSYRSNCDERQYD